MWYRIELNKDRSVRSCVEVSGSLNEGRSIHYIEADSKESAIAILAKKYEVRRKDMYTAKAKWLAKTRESGSCVVCAAPRGEDGTDTYCRKCLARKKGRRRAVAAGAPRLTTRNDTAEKKAIALAARADQAREYSKQQAKKCPNYGGVSLTRKVYRAALRAFDQNPSYFREWLVAQIQECQDKIDGKDADADLKATLVRCGYEIVHAAE